jgi:hypothetical protein
LDANLIFESTFTITVNGGENFKMKANNTSFMNFQDDFTVNFLAGDEILLHFDDDSEVQFEDLILNIASGDDHLVFLNNNSATGASFTVSGTTSIKKPGGSDLIFSTRGIGSTMTFNGLLTANCPGTSVNQILRFDADAGNIKMGTAILSRSLDMGEIDFDLDGGNVTIADLTLNSSGTLLGNQLVSIDIDGTSIFNCTGNIEANISGGDDFRIGLNANIGSTAQFLVGGNLTTALSGGDDINWYVYRNSLFQVTGNIVINKTGGEQTNIELEDNGSLICTEFLINQSGGKGLIFTLADASSVNILGELSLTCSAGGAQSSIELLPSCTATFDVANDFTFNLDGSTFDIALVIDDGTINIGGDVTLNNTVYAGAKDIEWFQDGNSVANIAGDFIVNLSAGDDIDLDFGQSSAGSNSSLNISGDLILNQGNPGA